MAIFLILFGRARTKKTSAMAMAHHRAKKWLQARIKRRSSTQTRPLSFFKPLQVPRRGRSRSPPPSTPTVFPGSPSARNFPVDVAFLLESPSSPTPQVNQEAHPAANSRRLLHSRDCTITKHCTRYASLLGTWEGSQRRKQGGSEMIQRWKQRQKQQQQEAATKTS